MAKELYSTLIPYDICIRKSDRDITIIPRTTIKLHLNLKHEDREIFAVNAVEMFNVNPHNALVYLAQNNYFEGGPVDAAHFIIDHAEQLSKSHVGEFLGGIEEFNQCVCAHVLTSYYFKRTRIEEAIRRLVKSVKLPSNPQQLVFIMEKFGGSYSLQNEEDMRTMYASESVIGPFAISILKLNLNLHNPSIPLAKKMTVQEFINYNAGINAGSDLSKEQLRRIYTRMGEIELKTDDDIVTKGRANLSSSELRELEAQTSSFSASAAQIEAITRKSMELYATQPKNALNFYYIHRKEVEQGQVESFKEAVGTTTTKTSLITTSSPSPAMAKELSDLRKALDESKLLNSAQTADISKLRSELAVLQKKLYDEEQQTRILRATVTDLKGNVRVVARVRPFLKGDHVDADVAIPHVLALSDGESIKVVKSDKNRTEEVLFRFDRSFGPQIDQERLFVEVSEFVQSALDGFNVCIFSYGQTGSGKTYTMTGGIDALRGIIPRSMEQVAKHRNGLAIKGWKFKMSVTYVEIYNETIRDLLRENKEDKVEHEIKRDIDGSVYVSNVHSIDFDPNDTAQVQQMLAQAARFRSQASTNMNDVSSRSHSIFTLRLEAENDMENLQLKGSIALVDLAGSERLDRSGATGDAAKEAMAINKSLSALADVFLAIGNKDSHIPYRNSKLTSLLQPALGGDGRTLMVISLSPTEASSFESYSSCRFATQVNKCELGKPKKHINDVSVLKAEMKVEEAKIIQQQQLLQQLLQKQQQLGAQSHVGVMNGGDGRRGSGDESNAGKTFRRPSAAITVDKTAGGGGAKAFQKIVL